MPVDYAEVATIGEGGPRCTPRVRHPAADPGCEACGGAGYFAADYDGRAAVQRCDACLWHGPDDPRTVYDDDVVPFAIFSGIPCRKRYPCFVRREKEGKA